MPKRKSRRRKRDFSREDSGRSREINLDIPSRQQSKSAVEKEKRAEINAVHFADKKYGTRSSTRREHETSTILDQQHQPGVTTEEILGALVYVRQDEMPVPLLEEFFALTRLNMKDYYDKAGEIDAEWIWRDEKKRKELFDNEARYVVAVRAGSSSPASSANRRRKRGDAGFIQNVDFADVLGFVHVRFENSMNQPVLYVYELQVKAEYQSMKVGQALMSAVEGLGTALGCVRIGLTVFKVNKQALSFYTGRGYEELPDELRSRANSPRGGGNRNVELISDALATPRTMSKYSVDIEDRLESDGDQSVDEDAFLKFGLRNRAAAQPATAHIDLFKPLVM
jgi:ribosomal protein S18 acetylase RimI-like enzyme